MSETQHRTWKTNDRGSLSLRGVHDARLLSISYDYPQDFKFSIKGANEEITEILLSNIRLMNIVELWESTIIDSIYIWSLDNVPNEHWKNLDLGWNLIFKNRIESIENKQTEAARLSSLYPQEYLIDVVSSYGGAWSAVCKNIVVNQRSFYNVGPKENSQEHYCSNINFRKIA